MFEERCIFVDARMIMASGIGRHLAGHLEYLAGCDLDIIAGVQDEKGAEKVRELAPRSETLPFRSAIYSCSEHLRGSLLARSVRARASLFWYPHYNAPWWTPSPAVVTVHDLIHLNLPMFGVNKIKVQAARRVLSRSIENAKRIVCVSSDTAAAVGRFSPKVKDKIRVVRNPLAGRWGLMPASEIVTFRESKGLSRYLLLVGNKKPHKNHGFAFKLIDELASSEPDLSLVAIGRKEPWWEAMVKSWGDRGGRRDKLVDIDFVSDAELKLYYGGAEALLMPSLHEGFGYPPLEAMACGTPVVCSDRGALPETVGDAAIVLDPLDLSAWVEAVNGLLRNELLRNNLLHRGIRQVQQFAQGNQSRILCGVFEEAIEEIAPLEIGA